MITNLLLGKRIFIIEDDIVNLYVYSKCLSKNGASIFQDVLGYGYAKGIVLHILECLPIDLIILDIMLRRGVNGYDVYDAIRANTSIQNIPVVAVTALDPETEIPKAKAKGLNGYISKPVNSVEFYNQIKTVLDGEKIWIISR